MQSGRPSIGPAFHARVEAYLKEHPELGYQSTGELVKDLLRRWLEEHAEANAYQDPATSAAPEAPEAATSA